MAESLYKDTDPLGVEHLKNTSKAPLAAAMRFVSRLEVVRPTDEETLRLKAEVQPVSYTHLTLPTIYSV